MTFIARRVFARFFAVAVVAIAFFGISSSSDAAIMYGDFSDIPPGVVMYLDVTESSSTDPVPPPRYGAPEVVGNNIDFDPINFGANAVSGDADIFDGQLNFSFMAMFPGTGLDSITITESGDFTLAGSGTSATSVAAGIFASVEITYVDGSPLPTPITVEASTDFSEDLLSSPGLNQPWGNTLFVDFGPALLDAGFGPDSVATKGEVVLDDTLLAISESDPSTVSFIAKKDFKIIPGGDLDRNDIPEPTAVAFTLMGMMGLAMRRRAA